MSMITSALGAVVGKFFGNRTYWAVKLRDDSWRSELDVRTDAAFPGGIRPFDWTLDLVDTGEVAKIKELWLLCPPNRVSPIGNTVRIPITEPGTAFQFKVASLHAMGADGVSCDAQIVGRVTDKETGACEFFAWDHRLRELSLPMQSNVYDFGPWRAGMPKQGALSFRVLGLDLS